jgi:trimeric autotransporter adhesin
VLQGNTYTDAGASATDNADGDLTASIVTSGTVDTSVTGIYHITYNVTDAAGNPATQVTRTVNVTNIPTTTIATFPTVNIANSGAVGFTGTCTNFGIHNTDDTIYIKIEDASGSMASASAIHCN